MQNKWCMKQEEKVRIMLAHKPAKEIPSCNVEKLNVSTCCVFVVQRCKRVHSSVLPHATAQLCRGTDTGKCFALH